MFNGRRCLNGRCERTETKEKSIKFICSQKAVIHILLIAKINSKGLATASCIYIILIAIFSNTASFKLRKLETSRRKSILPKRKILTQNAIEKQMKAEDKNIMELQEFVQFDFYFFIFFFLVFGSHASIARTVNRVNRKHTKNDVNSTD